MPLKINILLKNNYIRKFELLILGYTTHNQSTRYIVEIPPLIKNLKI